MARRKYARFRDEKSEYSECANQKCKWIGKDDEKLRVPDPQIEEMQLLVCPKCSKPVFRELVKEFQLTEKPENF